MKRNETEQLTILLSSVHQLENTGTTAKEAIEVLKEGLYDMIFDKKTKDR